MTQTSVIFKCNYGGKCKASGAKDTRSSIRPDMLWDEHIYPSRSQALSSPRSSLHAVEIDDCI